MYGQGNNVRLYPLFTFEHFNLWDFSEPWKDADARQRRGEAPEAR